MDNPIYTILDLLDRNNNEAAKLQTELRGSLLIQQIWPEAFMNNCRCSFGGLMNYDGRAMVANHTLIEAWFVRADGVRYRLNESELKLFKPDMVINRNFRAGLNTLRV